MAVDCDPAFGALRHAIRRGCAPMSHPCAMSENSAIQLGRVENHGVTTAKNSRCARHSGWRLRSRAWHIYAVSRPVWLAVSKAPASAIPDPSYRLDTVLVFPFCTSASFLQIGRAHV